MTENSLKIQGFLIDTQEKKEKKGILSQKRAIFQKKGKFVKKMDENFFFEKKSFLRYRGHFVILPFFGLKFDVKINDCQ